MDYSIGCATLTDPGVASVGKVGGTRRETWQGYGPGLCLKAVGGDSYKSQCVQSLK